MTAPRSDSWELNLTHKERAKILAKVPVQAADECWHMGGSMRAGYRGISIRREGKQRYLQAHRVLYRLLVGPISVGMVLDHLCHTEAAKRGECEGGPLCLHRSCVNPSHMEPVSFRDNLRRRVTGNDILGVCKRGHAWVEENIVVAKNGSRRCGPCLRLGNRHVHGWGWAA